MDKPDYCITMESADTTAEKARESRDNSTTTNVKYRSRNSGGNMNTEKEKLLQGHVAVAMGKSKKWRVSEHT